jgi:O-antigen ligase
MKSAMRYFKIKNISLFSFLLLIGVLIPYIFYFQDYSIIKLLVLPCLFLMILILYIDFKYLIYGVLLFRSICDPIFSLSKSTGGMGIGALVNMLVIGLLFICILKYQNGNIDKKMIFPWGIYLLACFFMSFKSPIQMDSLRQSLTLLSNFCMFLFPFFLIKKYSDFVFFNRLIIYSSCIPLVVAIIELLNNGMGMRVHSTFSHPNVFAFYLIVVIVSSFLYLKENMSKSVSERTLINILLILQLCAMLLTQTRSAWFVLLLMLACYAFIKEPKYIIYVFLLIALAMLIPEIRDRITNLSSGNEYVPGQKLNSYAWRLVLWESSIPWILDSAFIGHGVNTFRFYSPVFFPLERIGFDAHNVYVQTAFEVGVLGLLFYLSIFYFILVFLIRNIKSNFNLCFLSILLTVGYLFISYSDNVQFYLSFNWYFWFFMGNVIFCLKSLRGDNG